MKLRVSHESMTDTNVTPCPDHDDSCTTDVLYRSHIPICIWDNSKTIADCNEAFLNFLGIHSKKECLSSLHLCLPNTQEDGETSKKAIEISLDAAFKEGTVMRTWNWQHMEGHIIPSKITLLRIKYNGRDKIAIFSYDQREIQRAQEKAKEAQKIMYAMLNSMPYGACIMSTNMQIIECNDTAFKLFGFNNKKEFIENFKNLSPERQPNGKLSTEYTSEVIEKCINEGHVNTEWMHIDKNGKPLPVELTLGLTKYNKELMILAYTRDLRELKATQELVKEAELRNTLMLDTMPLCVHFWDENLNLIYTNLEGANVFGFDTQEEYIQNFHLTWPEYQPNGMLTKEYVAHKTTKAFETGYVKGHVRYINIKTKEEIPLDVTILRTFYRGKYGLIAYLKDMREHYAMMQKIKDNEEILRAAKDIAERSTKAKGEFLANMSHEIRTPMNGILGLLHLLQQTPMNTLQETYVQKSLFSTNNLMRIINDILDFSKIEAGKLEMEEHPFTLEGICQDIIDLYGNTCTEKGLKLLIKTDEHSKNFIIGDALRLKQVLFNLVSNAIKFTKQGSVSLTIESTIKENNLLHCTFTIQDTGIGLSPEQISRLFSAFTQAESSTSRQFGGTGLGLVISRKIIEMMQGNIWVESTLGQGTSFYCTALFPLDAGQDFKASQEKYIEEKENISQENLTLGHILLVEDNEINQIVAREILQSVGYTLDIANHGQEALDLLEQNTYDIVLMDIQMPVMGGYTTTKHIRAQEKYQHLPIIAMSAHAMKGDKETSLSYGMNDHITKPIDANNLYKTLNMWITKSVITNL